MNLMKGLFAEKVGGILIVEYELLKLLLTRPEKGLEVLMDSYMGLVYAVVADKLLGVIAINDIEECVSDVFLFSSKRNH